MSTKKTLAFIGLGVMGGPMAGHLARAGYRVTAFNRSAQRAAKWRGLWEAEDLPVTFAKTPADAAQGAEIVLTCVGNDEDLAQVTLEDQGALEAMAPGTVLIDHTTTSADQARRLQAACAARDIGFIDAPVSGGQDGQPNVYRRSFGRTV
jgi:3-hydroxyisobutyrate dehydrogenase